MVNMAMLRYSALALLCLASAADAGSHGGSGAAVTPGAQPVRYFNQTFVVMEAVRSMIRRFARRPARARAINIAAIRPRVQLMQRVHPPLPQENFTSTSFAGDALTGGATAGCRAGAWSPCVWGDDDNLFSSDVSNVFLSRRAYLHADADATLGAVAEATVPIAATDRYHVLARYEAGYRFSSPFKVAVAQGGETKFEKTFGLRTSPKLWQLHGQRANEGNGTGTYGCGAGLVGECRWPWSSTENQVWEGVHDTVNLTAGVATIALTVVGVDGSALPEAHAGSTGDRWGIETASGELITERNVDAIMLFPNSSDLALRMTDMTSGSDGVVLDALIGTHSHGRVCH
jgi:hypothetical protein